MCQNRHQRPIYECVRSIINFHPRNQDVDFDMFEMFFSFQCKTKLKKRDVVAPKCTIATQPPFPYHNGNDDNPQRSLQQVASGRRDVRGSSREEFQKIFGQFYSPHHELEIT